MVDTKTFWLDLPMPDMGQIETYLALKGWEGDYTRNSRGAVWTPPYNIGELLTFNQEWREKYADEVPGHVRDLIDYVARVEDRNKAEVYLDILRIGSK
jgi:hypothetical protein